MFNFKKGNTIGIVSPSAPITAFCPKRLARGVRAMIDMGYKVKLGKNVSSVDGFTAGTIKERVQDIHDLFSDKDVKLIMATIGGYNCNDLLEFLDYEMIRKNPKIFVGYSDCAILNSALFARSGIKTIMGPMVLPQFGEYPAIQDFSKESFINVVENIGSNLRDKEDSRPRRMEKNIGWKVVFPGQAKGRIIAANLNTLTKLIGTKYIFDFTDAILFLEDDDDESAATVQRMLWQLKQAGLLDKIKGLVFGRFQKKSEIGESVMKKIVENVLGVPKFPVVYGLDFGHTDPVLSLPNGNEVEILTKNNKIVILL